MKHISRVVTMLLVAGIALVSTPGHGSEELAAPAANPAVPSGKVPENTLIVKGAWSSASDAVTPLPEGGKFAAGVYQNDYFGMNYPFSDRWQKGLEGPPVSDSGYYVLAQIVASDKAKDEKPGHMLIAAQDIFFTPTDATSALELVNFSRDHLDGSVYKVERAPSEVKLGSHSFVRFDYESPAAELHWYVLATQIRCHVVEFVFTSHQPKVLADLLKAMSQTQLPADAGARGGAGGGDVPVCIKDYATPANIIEREDPILTEPRYNPIPVRIIIDKQGKVKHIHFLRAFPDQAKTVTDALLQWRFKPHLVDGQAVEVETGIMFGRKMQQRAPINDRRDAVHATPTSMSSEGKSSSY
jgi:hypothetical protein